MLTKINKTDLIISNTIEDDRVNTYVHLLDYDWMNYNITSRLTTKKLGLLEIKFEYFGFGLSYMHVAQVNLQTGDITYHEYSYSSTIFKKYLADYLSCHIESLDKKEAFYNDDVVINFYNEVVENHTQHTNSGNWSEREIKSMRSMADRYKSGYTKLYQ